MSTSTSQTKPASLSPELQKLWNMVSEIQKDSKYNDQSGQQVKDAASELLKVLKTK